MTNLFLTVLLLASLLIVPNQPTVDLRVVVIYRNFRGQDRGIGAGWPINVYNGSDLNPENLVSSHDTNVSSEHTFELPTGRYIIKVEFTGGTPSVDYQCLQFYLLEKDSTTVIRCMGTSWLPFLSD